MGQVTVTRLQVQQPYVKVGARMIRIKLEGTAQHTRSFFVTGIAEEQPAEHIQRIWILGRKDNSFLGSRNPHIFDIDVILSAEDRQQSPVTCIFRCQGRRGLIGLQGTDQISRLRMRLTRRDEPGRVLGLQGGSGLELKQRLAEISNALEIQPTQTANRGRPGV